MRATQPLAATVVHTVRTRRKRKRSKQPISFTKDEPKRRKLDSKFDETELAYKLRRTARHEQLHDVVFNIHEHSNPPKTAQVTGIRAFFAAHSPVLLKMFDETDKPHTTPIRIEIDEISIVGFQYLKQYTHFEAINVSTLLLSTVIDVLYAAKCYQIDTLIVECRERIKSIETVDEFYCVMHAIGKYEKGTFGHLDDLVLPEFVFANFDAIIEDAAQFQTLELYIVKWLLGDIVEPYQRYIDAKSYCMGQAKKDKCYKYQAWIDLFRSDFYDLMDFTGLKVEELKEVKNDGIMDDDMFVEYLIKKAQHLEASNAELLKRVHELEQQQSLPTGSEQ